MDTARKSIAKGRQRCGQRSSVFRRCSVLSSTLSTNLGIKPKSGGAPRAGGGVLGRMVPTLDRIASGTAVTSFGSSPPQVAPNAASLTPVVPASPPAQDPPVQDM